MTFKRPFEPLPEQINKYSRGKLVLIVGSSTYTGAAALSASAAERMGAGYTEVITSPEALTIVRQASYSLVVRDVNSWDIESLTPSTNEHPFAVGIGSGFEGSASEFVLTRAILERAQSPVLIDGKALDYVGHDEVRAILRRRKEQGYATVLTPHGGEAARLAQAATLQLDDANPAANAHELAVTFDAIVVLKGPDTYISDGTTTTSMTLGTPALAKAGTGDVLAGMISSLLAQGVEPLQAAITGSQVHAEAGREAARTLTETAVIASDLVNLLPLVIAKQ